MILIRTGGYSKGYLAGSRFLNGTIVHPQPPLLFLWHWTDIVNVMKVCTIIRNMIVEKRRDTYASEMSSLHHDEEARVLFGNCQVFQWESWAATEGLLPSDLPMGMWATIVA